MSARIYIQIKYNPDVTRVYKVGVFIERHLSRYHLVPHIIAVVLVVKWHLTVYSPYPK